LSGLCFSRPVSRERGDAFRFESTCIGRWKKYRKIDCPSCVPDCRHWGRLHPGGIARGVPERIGAWSTDRMSPLVIPDVPPDLRCVWGVFTSRVWHANRYAHCEEKQGTNLLSTAGRIRTGQSRNPPKRVVIPNPEIGMSVRMWKLYGFYRF
jgi:hypothetical protein